MEKYGQILYTLKGFPDKASNQKKQIFDKKYLEIFGENNFVIEDSVKHITDYFEIKKLYEESAFEVSDQKIFYIMYMQKELMNEALDNLQLLEDELKTYVTDKEISAARKLIQVKFREALDESISKIKSNYK